MYSLLLDTSSKRCIIAINKKKNPLIVKHVLLEKDSSKIIFPSIKKILEKTKVKINFVSVGIGPGSYTGIRIAAVIAKTLSFANKIPIISFCSLKGFIPKKEGPFISIMDAKRGNVHLLKGKREKEVQYFGDPLLLPINEMGNYKNHLIVSPNLNLKDHFPKRANKKDQFNALHDEFHLAKLTFENFENKKFTSINNLKLYYTLPKLR
jgi:tRNA threonylcarbamoyl adenosine modification protein YeaZ